MVAGSASLGDTLLRVRFPQGAMDESEWVFITRWRMGKRE
jgi:hypothetical protein